RSRRSESLRHYVGLRPMLRKVQGATLPARSVSDRPEPSNDESSDNRLTPDPRRRAFRPSTSSAVDLILLHRAAFRAGVRNSGSALRLLAFEPPLQAPGASI